MLGVVVEGFGEVGVFVASFVVAAVVVEQAS